MRERGRFITFEGIDGAGKSTHLDWFRARLAARIKPFGHDVVSTREPGGTPLGEALREIILHQPMDLQAEALLMFAARRQHMTSVIKPALERGDWVLSDRFTDATFAYQGGGRGLPAAKLEVLESWVQEGFQPDKTILFDVPADVASARRGSQRTPDRFEQEPDGFFERVRNSYMRRAAQAPARFVIVDASHSIELIRTRLEAIIAHLEFGH